MVRPTSHLLSLTFKCQSTAAVLVSRPAVAESILWNRVCPSFPLDICQGVFLEFNHEISLDFAMVLETLIKLWFTARFFGKTFLLQKLGKWAKNTGFFILKKKLVINFHWICSIMKMLIICCVFLHKSYIWEKSCSWDIGQNALSQLDCMFLKWTNSPEEIE